MEKTQKSTGKGHDNTASGFAAVVMQKKSFIKNFFMFFIPTLVLILMLGVFTLWTSNNFNKEIFEKSNTSLLKQIKTNMDLMLNELDAMNMNFDYNVDISLHIKSLLESPSYSLEEYRISQLVKSFVSTPANAKSFISCIYVYYKNSRNRFISSMDGINTLDDFNDTSWFASFCEQDSEVNWWAEIRHISHYEYQEKTPVITIYKKIYSPGVYDANGVIVLNIYMNYLEKMLEELVTYKDQSLLVMDKNGSILYGSRQSKQLPKEALEVIHEHNSPVFTGLINKKKVNIFVLESERYGWKYVSVVPETAFSLITTQLRRLTVFLLLLSLILAVVSAYYLTRKNHGNIIRIVSIIDSAENQRPLPPLPEVVKDEYSYIIHSILKTFFERSYLKLQLSERKYKLQNAELLSLQSQINPHFLHNTLETIYWEMLKFSGKPTIAHKMLENLSDMLKYSLNSKDDFVRLKEEIENTVSYIEIQKYRYEDKFDVFWEYSQQVNDIKVKKLIFQPLIENSIYHGIQKKKGYCFIRIKIIKTASYLRIFVVDNGAGIQPERLKAIKRELETSEDMSEHIGLFNTNKRMKLTYGEAYGIRIRSRSGVGTVVCLRIPIQI